MASGLEAVAFSIIGGIGTGALGIITIAVQQRYSENTKQISATLAELEKMTDFCSQSADKVWSVPGNPSSFDVSETVCTLHEIAAYTRFITDRVKNSGLRLNSALVNYRAATSGDDFDVKDRPPQADRKLQIRTAAVSLKIAFRAVDFERRQLSIPFFS